VVAVRTAVLVYCMGWEIEAQADKNGEVVQLALGAEVEATASECSEIEYGG
jgi:hypothetical protein